MLSKFSLSLTAVLALSAAAGGAARAAPVATSSDEARQTASPHSRPNTNDELNAAESGSPDSVDNKDQQRPPSGHHWRADRKAKELND